jgi:hypothetical protein
MFAEMSWENRTAVRTSGFYVQYILACSVYKTLSTLPAYVKNIR